MKSNRLLQGYLYKRLISFMAVLLCGAIIMGAILLIVVYALPTGRMRANVARNMEVFSYEGDYQNLIDEYPSTRIDNFTNALMLLHAIHPPVEGAVRDAMNVWRTEYDQRPMSLSLVDYIQENPEEEPFETSYGRYWHGYQIFLKPLLLVGDFGDIRMLNMICQGMGILAVAVILAGRCRQWIALAFGLTVLLMNPAAMALSFEFSPVFYIAVLAMIYILRVWERRQGEDRVFHFALVFFLLGIATAYFDLLSFPLVALGLPLTLFFCLEEEMGSWKRSCKTVLLFTVCWSAGYGGMWMGKLVIGSLLTGNNLLGNALNATKVRVGAYEETSKLSYLLDGIKRNLGVVWKWPYTICIAGGCMIWVFYAKIKDGKRRSLQSIKSLQSSMNRMAPFLLIMLLPLIHAAASNHIYIHFWFTFRELAISLFAAAGMLSAGLKAGGSRHENSSQNG